MEDAGPAFPWGFLVAGLACAALGLLGLIEAARLDRVARALGGPALTDREARRLSRLLLAAGACCLFTVWGSTWPFAHGQRPYWVVLGTTAALPLSCLLVGYALLDLTLLRRLRRP